MNSIGERIKYHRKQIGLTQQQLAEPLGLLPANISSYERNKSVPPSDKLAILADVLNTTTDYLTCRTDDSSPLDRSENKRIEKKHTIPIVGNICAGDGIIAEENIQGYAEYPLPQTATPDFSLRVKGDSMIGAGIVDGDIVFLKKKNWADYNGQIVAVVVDGEGSLKRMKWSEGSPYIKLIPENDNYRMKEVLPNELIVCGVYCGHFHPEIINGR
ncbi:LexA family protein [Paenibacillus medicaginis]|uniref:LexA family protein n=1 Tax=Paenibacillus medicaginis TaxID=1470560 RepID=A0ABV5C0U4_9BACL